MPTERTELVRGRTFDVEVGAAEVDHKDLPEAYHADYASAECRGDVAGEGSVGDRIASAGNSLAVDRRVRGSC
jgi:hypothetical protein